MTELHEPFPRIERQRGADRLGMVIFLGSELMLFGGVFAAALALRLRHPDDYRQAAHHLKLWLGTANTAVLLTSSLFAALAVAAARAGRPKQAGRVLVVAVLLGLAFLGIKGAEYAGEYREGLMPGTADAAFDGHFQQLFMNLYFVGTGLHALHVTIGIALMAVAAASRAARADREAVLFGNVALYWHFVDVVWVFLYPTLYLAGAR
ncbi:cytochrome c oxidase subunit 3 [Sphingomonas sp. ac-8]|uniref:cytochrome c oxidase subunit 3 n=1 Tax=Sphingomonas sp. ac-8 TaxID=3242977 RepID=UPI003A8070C8